MRIAKQNTEAELDAFVSVCTRLSGFDAKLDAEWVDGYLTALAAGPRVIPPHEWLPRMCGDAFERAFADPDDVAQALAVLLTRARALADQLDPESLLEFPDQVRLSPVMSEWDDAAREELRAGGEVPTEEISAFQTGTVWAFGFSDAVEDFADVWSVQVDNVALAIRIDLMLQITALQLPPGDELDVHLKHWMPGRTPTRDDLIDEACFAIQDLRVWWLDHAPKPATRRVEATPGRNDPCSCGSGKKYKKCHGASA